MDGPVGAFCERFADGLCGAGRPGTQGHYLAAMLFLELQARFQSVGIGLIDLEGQIPLINPFPRGGNPQLRITSRNLLDGDDDLHIDKTPALHCPPGKRSADPRKVLLLVSLKYQTPVRPPKAEAIGKGVINLHGAGMKRNVIQVTGGVGALVIDGRRSQLIPDRHHRNACLQPARATQQMAGHGLGGAHRHLVGMFAETPA